MCTCICVCMYMCVCVKYVNVYVCMCVCWSVNVWMWTCVSRAILSCWWTGNLNVRCFCEMISCFAFFNLCPPRPWHALSVLVAVHVRVVQTWRDITHSTLPEDMMKLWNCLGESSNGLNSQTRTSTFNFQKWIVTCTMCPSSCSSLLSVFLPFLFSQFFLFHLSLSLSLSQSFFCSHSVSVASLSMSL